jgi:predicted CXXCH cytochrome family protein
MRLRFACLALVAASILSAQVAPVTGDVLGVHDLSPGSKSPVQGTLPGSCYYCHAPHSGVGGSTPLWNQKLSTQVYTPYYSTTFNETGIAQPPQSSTSVLCLSCHDGTVAPGQTQAYGTIPTSGSMKSADVLGTNLQSSHPVSMALPLKDAPYLAASLVQSGKTLDPTGAIHLVKGTVECNSCHSAHVQANDTVSQNFLRRDSSSGQMCLLCHDPNRVMATSQPNPLANWSTSSHAIATNVVTLAPGAPPVGPYHTVAQNACISCHAPHNGQGPTRLLRGSNEQDCIGCHNGSQTVYPYLSNISSEYAAPKIGHPLSGALFPHDAAEPMLLNQSRHSTCVDCHNAHSSNAVATFPPPPAVRPSQNGVAGISADGVTVVNPVVNQFENCLRCHGTSTGKVVNPIYGYLPVWAVAAGDPLNLVPQFALTSTSSHPVMHDRTSPLPQPSLLPYMLNLDGVTQGRPMGVRILCTDCHNSDDNREFGGRGPSGPHGSRWTHILERRYEFSQSTQPGQIINNLMPTPDLSINGPYALCAKCHDLSSVISGVSFPQHGIHINGGISCSACHTAHGMGSLSGAISGERLVNFDVNVVASNAGAPISYSRASNTCTLTCHGVVHPVTTGSSTGPTATKAGKGHK